MRVHEAVKYVEANDPPGTLYYNGRHVSFIDMYKLVLSAEEKDKVRHAEVFRRMIRQWVFSGGYELNYAEGARASGVLFEWTESLCSESWQERVYNRRANFVPWEYRCT